MENAESKQRRNEQENFTITPSTDFAWLLGVLAGHGHVDEYSIRFSTHEKELLNQIQQKGERVFKTNALIYPYHMTSAGNESYKITFHGNSLTDQVGRINTNVWVQTIQAKHSWILLTESNAWSFLAGFYEKRGHAVTSNYPYIQFEITSPEISDFIIQTLKTVDINNPRIKSRGGEVDNITAVAVYNNKEVKLFAQNIISYIPRKEKQLEYCRNVPDRTSGPLSVSEIIDEGIRLILEYGRLPGFSELEELRRQGKTKYSGKAYADKVGEGSLLKARDKLTQRAYERGIALVEKDPSKRSDDPSYLEEIICEAMELIDKFGTLPGTHIIDQLRKERKTKFSSAVYKDKFGAGKMPLARDELMRIHRKRRSEENGISTSDEIYP